MQIYVDGVLIVDGNDPYSTFNNNSEDLLIGWTEEIVSSFSPFKGRIDELRIYNRALTEDEVKKLHGEYSTAIVQPMKTIYESTFVAGLEGWTGHPSELRWRASGGNPSGYAYWHDIGAPSLPLSAPDKYLGDWSVLDGLGSISFDQKIFSTGNYNSRGYIHMYIAGPGGMASWRGPRAPSSCPNQPTCNWTTYVAPLMESQWIVTSGSWSELLANVTSFKITPELYGNVCCGPEISGIDNIRVSGPDTSTSPDLFGTTIQIPSNYEFMLAQNEQDEFPIQLTNTGDDSQSATLEIINPRSDLTVSTIHQNPITLAPAEVFDIPIVINADATPVGIYDDLLLKLIVENGETLYSNIKVTVVEQGAENLPDLSLRADDIHLADYTLGESATLNAVIHNKGQSTASSVQVRLYEFDSLLGETVLDEVPAEGIRTASITAHITTSGEHLIRVVADFSDAIDELDENNNEASQIIKLGAAAPIPGSILVTGNLPSNVYTNELFTISGQAVYDVYVDGVRYSNYVVKGGSVQITIKDDAGNEWVYGGVHTNISGYFAKTVQAPATTGTYQIFMTVTDEILSGKRDLLFSVAERPPVLPSPPPPPFNSGHGSWTYVPGSPSSPGIWTWVWTTPPVNVPLSETDLRVFSENIHFSRFNPELGDEITILAEIKYWATNTDLVALDVPVNFYVTYPGTPKMKIGETVINSFSVGAPDFGSRYVYTSWKNRDEGIHIVEIEINPSYMEENRLNNAATKAIIVGQLQSQQGAIAGQVTDPWGGVANIMIELYDSSGTTLPENKLTDDTGYYLFENVPVDNYQVHIVKPEGHRVEAETKPAEVTDQAVTEVDFHLIRQELPIADPNGPYLGPLEICFDGTGSDDPDGDPLTYYWDFGDGNTGSDVTPCNLYAEAGIYNVCLIVNDGTVDSQEVCTSAVIYDPSAGFVTGGGWIDSPEGAYKPDASLTGKANFGFVSKYKKGATVPTGQTEFQFQTASLNFHSDSYEWLVVTGGNFAKFKGDGTINGGYDENGNAYKFMLWAGNGSPDTFRIKIWSEDDVGNETVVYDNGFDQEISGGQVVIHVKK